MRDQRMLFNQVELSVLPGAALVIEGRNGSGKTTLLRSLCGLHSPEEGEVLWCGNSILNDPSAFHASLAYTGHRNGIKPQLSCVENLRFSGTASADLCNSDIDSVLNTVELDGYGSQLARRLSAGQQRRLALARLLLARAQLWILDEPFTALNKNGIALFERLAEDHLDAGGMLVMSSHHPMTLNPDRTTRFNLDT